MSWREKWWRRNHKKREMSYTRLNEVKQEDFDSIWKLTVVAGLKIIIGTAYLKPKEITLMQKIIKQRERVVNFYHQHNLEEVLFSWDCNARHYL